MNISCHIVCYLRGPLFLFLFILVVKNNTKAVFGRWTEFEANLRKPHGTPINCHGVICDLPKGIHSENKIENSIDKT